MNATGSTNAARVGQPCTIARRVAHRSSGHSRTSTPPPCTAAISVSSSYHGSSVDAARASKGGSPSSARLGHTVRRFRGASRRLHRPLVPMGCGGASVRRSPSDSGTPVCAAPPAMGSGSDIAVVGTGRAPTEASSGETRTDSGCLPACSPPDFANPAATKTRWLESFAAHSVHKTPARVRDADAESTHAHDHLTQGL